MRETRNQVNESKEKAVVMERCMQYEERRGGKVTDGLGRIRGNLGGFLLETRRDAGIKRKKCGNLNPLFKKVEGNTK